MNALLIVQDPKLLGVEWLDGAPASLYSSPARDEIVAALLDAAQVGMCLQGIVAARCCTGVAVPLIGILSALLDSEEQGM